MEKKYFCRKKGNGIKMRKGVDPQRIVDMKVVYKNEGNGIRIRKRVDSSPVVDLVGLKQAAPGEFVVTTESADGTVRGSRVFTFPQSVRNVPPSVVHRFPGDKK